jgi:hypothetical protein
MTDSNKAADRQELLLREYEFCQSSAIGLETQIWQTGAAMGLGAVGTLIVVGDHKLGEQAPALVAVLIGALVSLTVAVWWRMSRRWWSIQHVKFARMADIEKEIGFYQARYLEFLDSGGTDLKKEQKHMLNQTSNHQVKGVQAFLQYLPYIVFIVWFVYCVLLIQQQATPLTDQVIGGLLLLAWFIANIVLLVSTGRKRSSTD